jgi:hypothetical protein
LFAGCEVGFSSVLKRRIKCTKQNLSAAAKQATKDDRWLSRAYISFSLLRRQCFVVDENAPANTAKCFAAIRRSREAGGEISSGVFAARRKEVCGSFAAATKANRNRHTGAEISRLRSFSCLCPCLITDEIPAANSGEICFAAISSGYEKPGESLVLDLSRL